MMAKPIQKGSPPPAKVSSPIQAAGERRDNGKHLDQKPLDAHKDRVHLPPSANHHPQGDAKPESPVRRPPPKSVIPDDEGDAEAEAAARDQAAQAQHQRRRHHTVLLFGLLLVTTLLGIGVIEGARYRSSTAEAVLTARISTAIAAHADLHSHDGQSYDEIALVDWIRRCLGTSLATTNAVIAEGLANASGQAIVTATERRCLHDKLVDLATKQVIAEETARLAGSEPMVTDQSHRFNQELHFVIAFARAHSYAIPDDFRVFKSDSGILKSHDRTEDAETATWRDLHR